MTTPLNYTEQNLPNRDGEHLRLLSIFFYIFGGLSVLFSCFPSIYVVMGFMFTQGNAFGQPMNPPPPPELGYIFMILGAVAMLLLFTMALLILLTARWLQLKKHYTFCFVIACLICLSVPFGTLLGVFTIIVLLRPSVKATFQTPQIPA